MSDQLGVSSKAVAIKVIPRGQGDGGTRGQGDKGSRGVGEVGEVGEVGGE